MRREPQQRRQRFRRAARVLAWGASLAAIPWIASLLVWPTWRWGHGTEVELKNGGVLWVIVDDSSPAGFSHPLRAEFRSAFRVTADDSGPDHNAFRAWFKSTGYTLGTRRVTQVTIPLWPSIVLLGASTFALFRLSRPPRPGLCPSCGYSLAGLAPGVKCPECGNSRSSPLGEVPALPGRAVGAPCPSSSSTHSEATGRPHNAAGGERSEESKGE